MPSQILIQKAHQSAKRIINDLKDRNGLQNEWENIDELVAKEIEQTWTDIIVDTFFDGLQ